MRAKLIQRDNGYFKAYELPCGCRFRITTEYSGWARKRGTADQKAALAKQDRERAAEIASKHVCAR